MRAEGLGELTRDVIIRIALLDNGGATLVTMRHSRNRGLLFRSAPLGELELDFCKVPRLRIVR